MQLLKDAQLHKRPRVVGLAFLWLFGLASVFLFPAPHRISDQSLTRYEGILKEADKDSPLRADAQHRLMEAQLHVADAKHWFWWFNTEQRSIVRKQQKLEAAAAERLAGLQREQARLLSDAKSELGLWSEFGVDEGRRLFWKSFQQGKVFGRQQTFWDAIMIALSGQERNLAGTVIQLICSAVVNFTLGVVVSVFFFLFKLPSLLMSYQAGLFSGTAFFFVAAVGALSVIAGFVVLLWGAGAGAVYTAATIAGPVRLGAGPRQRRYAMHYHTH